MTSPVFANVKIQGTYADELREEAQRRNLSQAALATEYVLEGMEARRQPNTAALASTERRIAATMLGLRGDIDSLTATVDISLALQDALIKLLLVYLPIPASDTLDGVSASAQERHEKLLRGVAMTGFEEGRPEALLRINALLNERLNVRS